MPNKNIKWYIYILSTEKDKLYTGITIDVSKRFEKHLNATGAKFTRSFKPKNILQVWETSNKSNALKLEIYIKKLTKAKKLSLIKTPEALEKETKLPALAKNLKNYY